MKHIEKVFWVYFTKVNIYNTFVIYKCYKVGQEIAVKM